MVHKNYNKLFLLLFGKYPIAFDKYTEDGQ